MWNYGWQATDAPGIAETFTERALASTSTAVSSLSTTLLRLWAALWSLGVPHFLGALVAIVASYALFVCCSVFLVIFAHFIYFTILKNAHAFTRFT